MSKRIRALQERKTELIAEAKELLAASRKDERDLTDDERGKHDSLMQELETVKGSIEVEEAQKRAELELEALPAPASATPAPAVVSDGFPTFGDFLVAVVEADTPGGVVDPRLNPMAAATGHGTTVPSKGGFLVRKDWSTRLLDEAMNESDLASRCTRVTIGADSDGIELPYVKETSRVTGSRGGGVRVYRRAEAATVTASTTELGKLKIDLEDLMAITYLTKRLMRDGRAMESIVTQQFRDEFAFVLDDEIIRGTGVGQCLGILNSDILVTQDKEVGQAANTILFENVSKMRQRFHAKNRGRMIWLNNQDTEQALSAMSLTVGTGGVAVYMPAGGLSVDGYDRLYGKPVIPIEQCSTLGDVGDLIAADMSRYMLIEKGGLEMASSMHVRFIYAEETLRFMMAVNGRPVWRGQTSLTPYKGADTISPFVTLQAR